VPILGWALACAGADAEPGLLVERDTVGDTVVVRTLAGSVRGEPYTLEPEIRIGVFEGEDAYMFGRVVSLAVAPTGSSTWHTTCSSRMARTWAWSGLRAASRPRRPT